VVSAIFRDRPLPGDFVIRRRHDQGAETETFVVTTWPDAETVSAGPFHTYANAFEHARGMVTDRYSYIWFDYARQGEPERLDRAVGGNA
jgi:hypothetical protein